jgi:hypothetical protein
MNQSAYLPCLPNVAWYITQLEFGLNNSMTGAEPFVKQTTRNRFTILTANGIQTLTIPVESTHGQPTPYSEVRISPEFQPKKILTALKSAYGKSAFFDFAFDDLAHLFLSEEKFLFNFNQQLLHWTLTWCKNEFRPNQTLLEMGNQEFHFSPYLHVFSDRFSFHPNLCILDVIFNQGRFDINQLGHVKKS